MARPKCPATGKVQHPGTLRAAEALGRAQARARMFGEVEPVRYYRCQHCRKWHLTSKPLKQEVR